MFKLERHKHLLSTILRSVNRPPIIQHGLRTQPAAATGLFNVNRLPNNNCGQQNTFAAEYAAVVRMLSRSTGVPSALITRQLHMSCTHLARSSRSSQAAKKSSEPSSSEPEPDPEKPKPPEKQDPPKRKDNDDKDDDKKNEKMTALLTKAVMWTATLYILTLVLTMVVPRKDQPETSTRYVSWHEFVHYMLAAGEVRELIVRPDMDIVTIRLHEGAIIKGRQTKSTIFHMAVADSVKFEQKLRDVEKQLGIKEGVTIKYERNSDVIPRIVMTVIITGLIFALLSRMKGMKSPISMDSFNQMTRAKFTLIDTTDKGKGVLFSDVAGLKEAKQEVVEFVDYLKTPEKYQRLGAKVPKGALLLGPPGCGKTLLAKAVATESKVPFLSMNGSEFIEMIGGLGAARVRDLFQEAKKRSPCIIYIDEIDAIGRQRSGSGGSGQVSSGESEQTLNQLLVEMDGMASKSGVLMLASTNRADVLDKALLRPGRFDRHITIDLPNLSEREEIFEKHLTGITLQEAPAKYSHRLAVLTPGFSGADIANVCNEAALHAARTNQKVVRAKDLEYAVERLVGGTEKRSHAMSVAERRVVAFHESGHALVGWLLPNSDVLQKVTIVPRTSLALGFAQYTPSEQKLFSTEQLDDKICMALGGRAAENITFSRITTGAQNDLEKVTKIAHAQVAKYGMNKRIGPMYVPDEAEYSFTGDKPFSKALGSLIDSEVRNVVETAYTKTEALLRANQDKLVKLAEALLERETLNYDDVVELIGPPAYDAAKRRLDPIEFEDSLKNLSGEK